jgi:VIT1/CCC1 family predicted Fe2+/Mn2+ transporter
LAHHTHKEEHFTASETIKDIVIGMSDGLTVPFALAAGLSGAVADHWIVVTAGLAEIAAGSIAMGLGGYLAARGDMEHYNNERHREEREVVEVPHMEEAEIVELLMEYGATEEESRPLMNALKRNPKAWVDFMMKFELGLEEPDPKRSLYSAVTIGGSYVVGGLIPLFPYIFLANAADGLKYSVGVTLIALFIFGYFKGSFTSKKPWSSAVQTMLIGGFAAAAAFLIAKLFSQGH